MSNERNVLKRSLVELANRHGATLTIAADDADLVRQVACVFGVPAPAFKEPHLPFEKHPALLAAVKIILASAGIDDVRHATTEAIAAILDRR